LKKIKVGDFVRIKEQKGTFKKGYEVTYSNKIYVVKNIVGETCELDDGEKVRINNLQVVNTETIPIDNKKKTALENAIKSKARLRKEGLN
jgi:hypothetical protein